MPGTSTSGLLVQQDRSSERSRYKKHAADCHGQYVVGCVAAIDDCAERPEEAQAAIGEQSDHRLDPLVVLLACEGISGHRRQYAISAELSNIKQRFPLNTTGPGCGSGGIRE